MSGKNFYLPLIAGIFIFFTTQTIWADTRVEDTFNIETKEVTKRKKAPPKFKLVEFTHKKHNIEYQISCGECHHDKDNNPLDLKLGDDVQRCVVCHTKLKKDKKDRKDIMVLENAMHGNCISCHKKINKKAGDKKGLKGPAPASCGKCHIAVKK
ncbi:MAG: cytochrome c3 family protein [Desulfobacula sp.]|nr:cytochrome c3 family protein [Desulfobacula sp.]